VAPPVFKTRAPDFRTLRQVIQLAESRIFSPSGLRRVTLYELRVGTQWALIALRGQLKTISSETVTSATGDYPVCAGIDLHGSYDDLAIRAIKRYRANGRRPQPVLWTAAATRGCCGG